jgi:hypothetical protein
MFLARELAKPSASSAGERKRKRCGTFEEDVKREDH